MRHRQTGFTLVELLVVIAIIGTLVAILLPAVNSAREASRKNTCQSNIRNLAIAVNLYNNSQKKLPGYINDVGRDPALAKVRASWTVMLFPYLEEGSRWDEWDDSHLQVIDPGTGGPVGLTSVAILQCPSDPTDEVGSPATSYVANCGRSPLDNTSGPTWKVQPAELEQVANGVFFDNSHNAPQPADERQASGAKRIRIQMSYIQVHDGLSKTALLSESVHSLYYAYTNGTAYTGSTIKDEKFYFGFVWSNDPSSIERINGEIDLDPPVTIMSDLSAALAFPSSRHPSSVNVAYCDSRVVSLSDSVDVEVYRNLMTSRSKASDDRSKGLNAQVEQ